MKRQINSRFGEWTPLVLPEGPHAHVRIVTKQGRGRLMTSGEAAQANTNTASQGKIPTTPRRGL